MNYIIQNIKKFILWITQSRLKINKFQIVLKIVLWIAYSEKGIFDFF